MPSSIPKHLLQATAIEIATKLAGHQYAIRGTASQVLQGFDMGVDDIDVICDQPTAKFILPDIQYSQSTQFKSYFGKIVINNIPIEIMGELQIKTKTGEWSKIYDASPSQKRQIDIDGHLVWVTTPQSELDSYLAMSRFSVYHKLKKQIS